MIVVVFDWLGANHSLAFLLLETSLGARAAVCTAGACVSEVGCGVVVVCDGVVACRGAGLEVGSDWLALNAAMTVLSSAMVELSAAICCVSAAICVSHDGDPVCVFAGGGRALRGAAVVVVSTVGTYSGNMRSWSRNRDVTLRLKPWCRQA